MTVGLPLAGTKQQPSRLSSCGPSFREGTAFLTLGSCLSNAMLWRASLDHGENHEPGKSKGTSGKK